MTHTEALETLHTCLAMAAVVFSFIGVVMYLDLKRKL